MDDLYARAGLIRHKVNVFAAMDTDGKAYSPLRPEPESGPEPAAPAPNRVISVT
ncbi:hypothetical protein ThrDRAFT_00757 [Frankia casuarinae]|jgi:hypothetical protein|nr:hypothetical protein CcI6DRAFT_00791 [Frankia sp. CcI6]EYT93693.1 hypothetical protein ThrDRAFT_00757 [Frankia casuarinae]KDA43916.1 hypothetical protein BMG523Draft_01300 [Frankia sp. BMG5.23]KEZ37381.1 hypothetical protein CEDDRAFT_01334 [Frankia sp. CeD]KFB05287.1 hypothetical protein ALLO2DRAFT_01822 [Frankia sp. Allo2]